MAKNKESRASQPQISFPVLLEFSIENYSLYPGAGNNGIHFSVQPGVTIVAGINGLGKTTLLNVLFRLLSGPVDWRKRKVGEMAGSAPIELFGWRDTSYFKNRVTNGAKDATASARLQFGEHTIMLKRSLQTLRIQSLEVDGEEREADDDHYQEAVVAFSSVPTFADFFLLLRYLVFFLEERQPLIWDPAAQTDLLRVLFYDREGALKARELLDAIQKADSDFRNRRYHTGKLEDQLAEAQAETSASADTLSLIKSIETKLSALADEEEEIGERFEEADKQRHLQRLKLEQAKVHLAEAQQSYAHTEQKHFSTLFPDASEIARQILVQAGAGGGCLVCGSRAASVKASVMLLARSGRCPVCKSEQSAQEGSAKGGSVSPKRLAELEKLSVDAAAAVEGLELTLSSASKEFSELSLRAATVQVEVDTQRAELKKLNASLPLSDGELKELSRTVATLQADLKRRRTALTALEVEYERLLADRETRVREVSGTIRERFKEFAKHFLAEDVELEYATDKRQIGEDTRQFEFQRFVVHMMSAGTNALQPRLESSEVSESQKEFLDLAFRMALIDVASSGRTSMMVLETPEASLDSVFMVRAGALLGRFAAGAGGKNRLIATSNLTRGEMISALLGAVPLPGEKAESLPHRVPEDKRMGRVLNLLKDATPNEALKKYRRAYELELDQALFPERYPRPKRRGSGQAKRSRVARRRR